MKKLLLASFLTLMFANSYADSCDNFAGNWVGYQLVGTYKSSVTTQNSYVPSQHFALINVHVLTGKLGDWSVSGSCQNGELKLSDSIHRLTGTIKGSTINLNGIGGSLRLQLILYKQ